MYTCKDAHSSPMYLLVSGCTGFLSSVPPVGHLSLHPISFSSQKWLVQTPSEVTEYPSTVSLQSQRTNLSFGHCAQPFPEAPLPFPDSGIKHYLAQPKFSLRPLVSNSLWLFSTKSQQPGSVFSLNTLRLFTRLKCLLSYHLLLP